MWGGGDGGCRRPTGQRTRGWSGALPAAIERTVLLQTPIGIVVRRDHLLADRDSVRWEDLEIWPIVAMREGTVMWERLHAGVTNPDVVVEAMTARTVKVMVANGAGIGMYASSWCRGATRDLPRRPWSSGG